MAERMNRRAECGASHDRSGYLNTKLPLYVLAAMTIGPCALIGACGGGNSNSPSPATTERVMACQRILAELQSVDQQEATEAELVLAMERADSTRENCEQVILSVATSPAEAVLYARQSDQFELYALWFEGALSRRFDNSDGYCDILGDTFRILLSGVADVEALLVGGELGVMDQVRLQELRDLDLEALDVLFLEVESQCSELLR